MKTKSHGKTRHDSTQLFSKSLLQWPLCAACCLGSSLKQMLTNIPRDFNIKIGWSTNVVSVSVCVFVYHFILIMGLCSWGVTLRLLSTSVSFCARSLCVSVPSCVFIGCQVGSCGCLGACLCIYVCVCVEGMSHCGPPARPCDSWGPLRQLRPTAHTDSVIMGGLLL